MNRKEIFSEILKKRSFLCIGLDSDIKKIPAHLLSEKDPVLTFNQAIIEATHDLAIAYKPNLAFYESRGSKGLETLEATLKLIPKNIFTIADAKRGDIGNTSGMYAEAFFNHYNFDSVTVAPYMGEDSVKPFLSFDDKWVILLALTSNSGAMDFQLMEVLGSLGKIELYKKVIKRALSWGNADNLMFVIGATRAEMLKEVRELAPDNFLLIPGVGAQGGSLSDVAKFGMNSMCGLLVNASRSILYASSGKDFAQAARAEALKMQQEMDGLLDKYLG